MTTFVLLSLFFACSQKNPNTVRVPEEDRGKDNYTMTGWVLLEKSGPISRHIQQLCAEAQDSTYIREHDIKMWADLPGKFKKCLKPSFVEMTNKNPHTNLCHSEESIPV